MSVTISGIRVEDLPNLGTVTDACEFVGDNAGTGVFTATAIKAYANKPTDIRSVREFGAVCDGITDDTAAINAAEAALNAAGGGILTFPAATIIVSGLTKMSNTIWQGAGWGATTLKLKGGIVTGAVVAGTDAYTLFGSNTLGGIDNWSIRDLTIDGNRSGGCTSDGLGVYGWAFDIKNVEIKSCNGQGWHNEYGQPGVEQHQDTQSSASDMLIWDNQTDGVYYGGPNDSSFFNINVYWNLHYGIWLFGQGTIKAAHCHVWSDGLGGRQHVIAWRVDSPINTLTACVGEGATVTQLWLRSVSNTIISGEYFYNQASPNAVEGIRLGDAAGTGGGVVAVSNNTIITRVDNCQSGAIIFSDDLGSNNIDIIGVNQTTASTGFAGSVGAAGRVRMLIANCTTNPSINTEALTFSAGGGLVIPGLGGGGGLVSVGATDSGGSGFRLLRVPN